MVGVFMDTVVGWGWSGFAWLRRDKFGWDRASRDARSEDEMAAMVTGERVRRFRLPDPDAACMFGNPEHACSCDIARP